MKKEVKMTTLIVSNGDCLRLKRVMMMCAASDDDGSDGDEFVSVI
jgi:hypothetical protein